MTSSGFVEGWAYDTEAPSKPLILALFSDGEEIARGVANRYRVDLMEAGIGTGWCAYRLRASGSVGRIRRSELSLSVIPAHDSLSQTGIPRLVEDTDVELTRLDEIASCDPTQIDSVEQLRGCVNIFADLISKAGVEAFVRAAYIYALGRGVDSTGLVLYSKLISEGQLLPFDLLQVLCESDEFQALPRILIAPTEPGFIFSAF